MIAEQFPQLENLNPQDQLLLAGELWQKATAPDGDAPDLPKEAVQLLEERLADYLKNPESGISWEELKRKVAKAND